MMDLCQRYADCMQKSDAQETLLDKICQQSLFFLNATSNDLSEINGDEKLEKMNSADCEQGISKHIILSFFYCKI